jgi:AcrR family transcriptional regulator
MAGDVPQRNATDDGRAAGLHEERELLIDAFTRTAAERGYAQTTVEEVTRRAGLPRSAFDAYFPDKRCCMIAAYDAFVARLAAQVRGAVDGDADWPEQVRAAVAAALEFLVETASRARVLMIEAAMTGPLFLERYVASVERAAEHLRRAREQYPRAARMPPSAESVLLGGVAFRIRAHLLAEEHQRLAELESEFVELLLRPYLGEQEAKQVAPMT